MVVFWRECGTRGEGFVPREVFWSLYGNRDGGFVPWRCFGGCVGTGMAVLFRGGGGDTGIDCVMGDEGRDGGLIGIERY